jgi:hypothetical protein
MSNLLTANARLESVDANPDDAYLGRQAFFRDQLLTNTEQPILNSLSLVKAVYVKNSTGGAIAGGLGCKWLTSNVGKAVGTLSGANEICDGVTPYNVPGNSIANGSYFWLIIEGPTKVEVGVGNVTAGGTLQTLASGKFADATVGTNPQGHSGRSTEAIASGSQARVYFNNPFSGMKF